MVTCVIDAGVVIRSAQAGISNDSRERRTMKFEHNGIVFSDEKENAKTLNEWCKTKKVSARVFLASSENKREFVIFNPKGEPVFASQKMEDVAVHIDIMALAEHMDE